ncbi:hypothetical protein DFH08DRAFT_1026731 [Mycena albidolilacea]|uniref:Uncharacterized protein n=1 Tax=Mycena albidolilacea TaxID=1033008 RepID=A0AAD7EIT1_9AGAR|nr:hypothetical protein DFH08DRAFT_1026731 [Mycena albidolilacea]
MTIWEIFTSMFLNNETHPVKVTATVVLSMAWSILVVVTLGVFLFLISDGKPSSSRDADNTTPPPAPVAPRPRVKITAWRILNTSVLLVLGTYKAVATYLGETAAPTNLDWMIGVVWALVSYWVSIVEQEAPSIAPWFFMTDWSRRVRSRTECQRGQSLTILPVIYGMVTLIFPHPIHWTVAHAILVAIAGLLVQMLIGLGTLALSMAYGTQLRRLYNTVRIAPFYDALFCSSDWSWRSMVEICIFTGLFFLSPVGVTVMLTTHSSPQYAPHTTWNSNRR